MPVFKPEVNKTVTCSKSHEMRTIELILGRFNKIRDHYGENAIFQKLHQNPIPVKIKKISCFPDLLHHHMLTEICAEKDQ